MGNGKPITGISMHVFYSYSFLCYDKLLYEIFRALEITNKYAINFKNKNLK